MMTVHCPACGAGYQIDEGKLPPEGRKLRCARCKVVWLAQKEGTEEPRNQGTEEAEVAPVAEGVADVEVAVEGAASAVEAGGEAAPEAPVAEAAVEEEVAGDGPPAEEEILIRREYEIGEVAGIGGWKNWVRGGNLWRSSALGLVVLGLLTGAGLVALKLMPKAAPAESAPVAVPVAADTTTVVQPPQGIVLHHVRGEVTKVEDGTGGAALTVRGVLANTTSSTLAVPPLRLELLGADGKVADRLPVGGVGDDLAAGAEQAWTASVTAPDMSAVAGWRIVFVKP